MTLKQFKRQYLHLRDWLIIVRYDTYTCVAVHSYLGRRAREAYEDFIDLHTRNEALIEHVKHQLYLRILLIDSFYEECIQTKIYTRF